MNRYFQSYELNAEGNRRIQNINAHFIDLLETLELLLPEEGRELELMRMRLEEACVFAKKAIALHSIYQA